MDQLSPLITIKQYSFTKTFSLYILSYYLHPCFLAKNTGLLINRDKSKIFFSKSCPNKTTLLQAAGMTEGKLPMKYIGIPLSINYLKARQYAGLIDRCREKVDGWMAKTLSYSGRIELIKSVIIGTIQYWVQAFNFPKSVIRTLERLCSFSRETRWQLGHGRSSVSRRRVEIRIGDLCTTAGVKLVWRCCSTDFMDEEDIC